METFVKLKGLIYLLLICGTVIYAIYSFNSKSSEHSLLQDTAFINAKVREAQAEQRAKDFETIRSQDILIFDNLINKEKVIIDNSTQRKQKIKEMSNSDRYKLFEKIYNVEK